MFNSLQKKVSLGDLITIALVVFLAGGFYYTTQYQIASIDNQINNHMGHDYRPLEKRVKSNAQQISNITSEVEAMRKQMETSTKRQDERFGRIQGQLDYIINRLDEQQ